MKSDVFKKELELIYNPKLREFIELCLNNLPDYFYEVSASGSGKYHPQYALGKCGLVRHVKASIGIACDLLRCEVILEDNHCNRDIVVSTLLLHDGLKNGLEDSGRMLTTHPLDVANYIEDLFIREGDILIAKKVFEITQAIKSHMGKWNCDKEGNEILPKPKTEMEKFVHLCDYLASRKRLEYIFEEQ